MIQFKFFKIFLLTCRECSFGDQRGNNMNPTALVQTSDVCGLEPGGLEKWYLGNDLLIDLTGLDSRRVYVCLYMYISVWLYGFGMEQMDKWFLGFAVK